MPYYNAGDYYQGDNYGAGDFLGIGKALKKVAGVAVGLLPGPVGAVGRALIGKSPQILSPAGGMKGGMIPQVPEPGLTGAVHRLAPGGHSGYGYYNKKGEFIEGRRPRMNVGNIKALKRANRRAHGFLRVYRSAVRYFVPKQPKGKAYVSFKKKR